MEHSLRAVVRRLTEPVDFEGDGKLVAEPRYRLLKRGDIFVVEIGVRAGHCQPAPSELPPKGEDGDRQVLLHLNLGRTSAGKGSLVVRKKIAATSAACACQRSLPRAKQRGGGCKLRP